MQSATPENADDGAANRTSFTKRVPNIQRCRLSSTGGIVNVNADGGSVAAVAAFVSLASIDNTDRSEAAIETMTKKH